MNRRSRLLVATFTVGGLLACAAASAATPVPKATSSTVVGDRVTLNFSGAIRPRVGGWTIVANGVAVKAKSVVYGPKRVQLVLPSAVFGDDTVRVVGRNLRSKGGARLKLVDAKPTNRSAAGCTQNVGSVTPGAANEGPTDWATFLRPNSFRVLSVQVDYADARPRLFDVPLRLEAVDTWVRALSYGRAGVEHTLYPGVLRMPKNRTAYAFTGGWGARKAFFQDVVQSLDAEIDFRRFDAVFVSSATTQGIVNVNQAEPVVLAAPDNGVVADGRELRHFGLTNDPATAFRGLLSLAGLPSLDPAVLGAWDPMVGPKGRFGLFAWHRHKLGWLEATQIRCPGSKPIELTLAPTWSNGGLKMILTRTSATTALVLENRQPGGLDAGQCRHGILAYEIRTDRAPGIALLPATTSPGPGCAETLGAPYAVKAGDAMRLGGALSLQVLAVGADGSYRLRVFR